MSCRSSVPWPAGFGLDDAVVGSLERDSVNFLEWAKTQAADHSDFLFSDLAPVASTTPQVAASAFWKVLSLSTKGLMGVLEQEEPYGEVSIFTC